jgi:hypothetical protein
MPEMKFYYCKQHSNGGLSFHQCPVCEDSTDLEAIKGEPNSLTSTAYQTGVIMERERIARLIMKQAEEWTKPMGHNPVRLLQALAETIRTNDTNG